MSFIILSNKDLLSGAFFCGKKTGESKRDGGILEDFYLVAGMQALAMKPWLIAQIFVDMKFSNPSTGRGFKKEFFFATALWLLSF